MQLSVTPSNSCGVPTTTPSPSRPLCSLATALVMPCSHLEPRTRTSSVSTFSPSTSYKRPVAYTGYSHPGCQRDQPNLLLLRHRYSLPEGNVRYHVRCRQNHTVSSTHENSLSNPTTNFAAATSFSNQIQGIAANVSLLTASL